MKFWIAATVRLALCAFLIGSVVSARADIVSGDTIVFEYFEGGAPAKSTRMYIFSGPYTGTTWSQQLGNLTYTVSSGSITISYNSAAGVLPNDVSLYIIDLQHQGALLNWGIEPGATLSGSGSYGYLSYQFPFYVTDGIQLAFSDGQTSAGSLVFGPISAVPEPATWAMMLIGFAGLGFTAHRGRRRTKLAT
jgi:hypothetical protein